MRHHRIVATLLFLLLAIAGLASSAAADHLHVLSLGNGQCVVLAADGAERFVQLPHAEGYPADRRHPLHVNVHLGEPGMRNGEHVIWVKGSPGDLANCAGYVNG